MTKPERKSIQQKITDRIVEMLDAGTVPWRPHHNCKSARPGKNISGRNYRGVNAIMTWAVSIEKGYASPYWLTFNQARELGGCVRKGEKGTPVVYYGHGVGKDDNGEKDPSKAFGFAKGYTVFNLEQIDGIADDKLPADEVDTSQRWANDPIESAREIIDAYEGPAFAEAAGTPHYTPSTDTVTMPPMDRFDSAEAYYSVYFHELIHSTGHDSRLARGLTGDKSQEKYGKEELIAEFGATFLCAEAGIVAEVIDNAAAYIDAWKKIIKADATLVMAAAAAAQKAVDCVLAKEMELSA